MFYLLRNSDLEISLDMSGVDDHLPSVALDMDIKWQMPFQLATLYLKECWFECKQIDNFGISLLNLIEAPSGKVDLIDLSLNRILTVEKSESGIVLTAKGKDTVGKGEIQFKTKIDSADLAIITESLKKLDKWW